MINQRSNLAFDSNSHISRKPWWHEASHSMAVESVINCDFVIVNNYDEESRTKLLRLIQSIESGHNVAPGTAESAADAIQPIAVYQNDTRERKFVFPFGNGYAVVYDTKSEPNSVRLAGTSFNPALMEQDGWSVVNKPEKAQVASAYQKLKNLLRYDPQVANKTRM